MFRGIASKLGKTWGFALFNAILAILLSVIGYEGSIFITILAFPLNLAGTTLAYAVIFSLLDGIVSFARSKSKKGYEMSKFYIRLQGYFLWLALFIAVAVVVTVGSVALFS